MSSSFAFNFSGDDIEPEAEDQPMPDATIGNVARSLEPVRVKPKSHLLADLLASLPSRIAYSAIEVVSPNGKRLKLYRRELFDVKMQLMAEDDPEANASVSGLDDTDIRTNVYEGGFKSWECSFDLARLLLDRGPRTDHDNLVPVDHVLELGCGTAIPSMVLFHHAIAESLPMYFTLADYNEAVLRLVTLPNLLLTWASTLPTAESVFMEECTDGVVHPDHGDLEVTPTLKARFVASLGAQSLMLNFVSGSWSPSTTFLSLIPTAPNMSILVLASETIYSPSALSAFTEAMVGILKQAHTGKAIVAAKRVYFGVGGSIDAFKLECREKKANANEIDDHGLDRGESSGVRRCLVEVQLL